MLHYFFFFQFFLPVFPWLRGFFNIGRLIFGKVKYYRRYELIKTEIQRKPVLCLYPPTNPPTPKNGAASFLTQLQITTNNSNQLQVQVTPNNSNS